MSAGIEIAPAFKGLLFQGGEEVGGCFLEGAQCSPVQLLPRRWGNGGKIEAGGKLRKNLSLRCPWQQTQEERVSKRKPDEPDGLHFGSGICGERRR